MTITTYICKTLLMQVCHKIIIWKKFSNPHKDKLGAYWTLAIIKFATHLNGCLAVHL